MPISVVVGGQFGSEGKGKVALEIVRRSQGPVTVVRVGGSNSGHTAYDRSGKRWALRHMPAACVDRNVDVIFPAGSYLDVEILFSELVKLQYPLERVFISPHANVVTEEHKRWEQEAGLVEAIGSTGSGVGAAVMAATARNANNFPLRAFHAEDHDKLQPLIRDTSAFLHAKLREGHRVVVEGSQGFGLSLLDGGYWPKATARSTTASAALAEAGLSPRHVDDVTLVLRSYPIRVAGDSGPLLGETSWAEIARRSGRHDDLSEYTTVTSKVRRVGEFDSNIVKRAIAANAPNRIVLNHLDYIATAASLSMPNGPLREFVRRVTSEIGQNVDWLGFSGLDVVESAELLS